MAWTSSGLPVSERIAANSVPVTSGCIEWRGYLNSSGYGMIRLDSKRKLVHRVAYALAFGPIEDGVCVLHRCDNRKCVNHAHLFLGDRAANNADKTQKGRQAKGPSHGVHGAQSHFAKLSDADVSEIRGRTGMTQRAIAIEFGSSQPNVHKILKHKSWSKNA